MKLLQDILQGVEVIEVAGSTHAAIANVYFDSRKVGKDALFVAVRGTISDGHEYINQAIEKGAVAIVAEEVPLTKPEELTMLTPEPSKC